LSSLPEAAQAVWFDYERGLQQAPGSLADLVHDDGLDFNDILNGTDNRVLTLYKPATVTAQRSIFCQLAHHVGARGVTSLGDVCQPTVVAECLTTISKRTDKRKSSYLKNIATAAITFALQSKLSEQDVERLRHMRDRVDPNLKSVKTDKRTGRVRRQYDTHRMGDRHRRRLEQFAEPENLRRLFALPELLIDPVRRKVSRKISVRPEDVNDAVVALIHVILLSAPIRRANLATLRIAGPTANVIIPKKGLVRISIDWTETKNAQPLFAELDIAGSDLLRFFVKKVRPVMLTHAGADVSNPFLFAGGAGDGHRAPGNLARLFTGRNRKHGGFHLNLHCMRHLAAKIVLDQDPAQMELVRQMLGHKTIETTRSYYAQAQSALAQHRYHEILASARGGSVEARAQ
jgi:integrase